MVRYFTSQSEANTAIRAAVTAGRCKAGYPGVHFLGGRAVYTAHVQDGAASWCLR